MGSKGSSSKQSSHLSDEQLTQIEKGGLSSSEAGHLESCPECANRFRDWRATATAYVEYRDSIGRPPAPQPWSSLDTLIAQHEETRSPRVWRWWPALPVATAVCLVLAIVVVYKTLPSRAVEQSSRRANELLARSSGVELPQGRLISMRVHGQTLIRAAVLITDTPVEREPAMADVQVAFAAAHYSWREPLSARSFQAWRSGLRNKRDSVSVVRANDSIESYRVRTDTPAGVLHSASLTLRAQDLRPTEGAFEFEGLGTVELSEAKPQAEGAVTHAPSNTRELPTETLASPEDALHVLAALNRIGADVGEPIDVTQDPERRHIVVRAYGLSDERQQQIGQVLKPLPRVVLDFDTVGGGPSPSRPALPERYSTSIPAPLRQRFENELGGASALQDVTDRVLEASASVLARAHALEVLARNFPPETEAHLTIPDRGVLWKLRDNHISELGRLLARIQVDLKPLLTESSNAPLPSMRDYGPTTTWQSGVPAIVALAQQTDKSLNSLLAGNYSQSAGEEMLRVLVAQIERFESAVRSEQKAGR